MKPQNDNEVLYWLLLAFAMGVVLGLMLRGGGRGRQMHREVETTRDSYNPATRARITPSLTFGNIIIGSNNAPDSNMFVGTDASGDED